MLFHLPTFETRSGSLDTCNTRKCGGINNLACPPLGAAHARIMQLDQRGLNGSPVGRRTPAMSSSKGQQSTHKKIVCKH